MNWISGLLNQSISCATKEVRNQLTVEWVLTNTHHNDVIMSAMASLITSFTIVYSTIYSSADQRKHLSPESLALVTGVHRWPVNSPHIKPVTRKVFPPDDVIINNADKCVQYQEQSNMKKSNWLHRNMFGERLWKMACEHYSTNHDLVGYAFIETRPGSQTSVLKLKSL